MKVHDLEAKLDHMMEHVGSIDRSLGGLKVALEPLYKVRAFQLFPDASDEAHEELQAVISDSQNGKSQLLHWYSHLDRQNSESVEEAFGLGGFKADEATPEDLAMVLQRHRVIHTIVDHLDACPCCVTGWLKEWEQHQRGSGAFPMDVPIASAPAA